MPKQRNRPHHHRHRERRSELLLPRISFSPLPTVPHVEYPSGLSSKPPPGFRRQVIIRFFIYTGAALLVLVVLGALFGGR